MPLSLIALAAMASMSAQALPTMASLRWDRRVVLMTAPGPADTAAATQRRVFAELTATKDDRDLVLVEVAGDTVRGASDDAAELRRTFKLPAGRFEAVLIGKDGGVKLRSREPLSSRTLAEAIDAMPMRRSGER